MNSRLIRLAFVFGLSGSSLFAGEFANLDFEQAPSAFLTIELGPFGTTERMETLLPNWTFSLGHETQSQVGFNLSSLDQILSSLHDRRPFGPRFNPFPSPPFEGHFGFIFRTQITDPSKLPSLAQKGTLPLEIRMIRIRVFGDPVKLLLNGTSIPMRYHLLPLPKEQSPYLPLTLAYANVSAFAGKEVTLRFEPDWKHAIRRFSGIDQIEFLNETLVMSESRGRDEENPIILRRLK